MTDVCAVLLGAPTTRFLIGPEQHVPEYLALRHATFVTELGLFNQDDRDDHDAAASTVVLVARSPLGEFLGGVRLYAPTGDPNLGWWRGGRLVTRADAPPGVGSALVRAACATADGLGAIRFDAEILAANRRFFERLGWQVLRRVEAHRAAHLLVLWSGRRFERLVAATKGPLASLLHGFRGEVGGVGLGGPGFVGDDGAPIPGSQLVTSVDAIMPSMVERDPAWAGWCGVLVGANDIAAMGALGNGLLDALGSPGRAHAERVLRGVALASQAYRMPVLGGHTQLGVPAALAVTAFGHAAEPIRGGGGRIGDTVYLTADLGGDWRPGYTGRQWDSTTGRRSEDLAAMTSMVARTRPHAAKDVSMAGVVGTLGMLAEASGVGAELDVAAIPRPAGTTAADWLTCFPGFAMVTAGGAPAPAGPAVSAACGQLTATPGVRVRWPDDEVTTVLPGCVTGLGAAA